MRLLELFSGTKSVGRAFEALGWEVTSLDTDATTRPTICADIQEWDYRTYPPGHFDFIWASPVCTEFSRALTRRPRRLTEGDGLVLKTIEIIGHLRPRWWAVENPRTGLLKSRPYMQALPYNDVSYCMYGFRYQKTEYGTTCLGFPANRSAPSTAAAKPSEMAGTPKPLRGKAAGTGPARPETSCTPCRPGCARRSRRA